LPDDFTPIAYNGINPAVNGKNGAGLAICYPQTAPWTTGFNVSDTSCAPPPTEGNFCKGIGFSNSMRSSALSVTKQPTPQGNNNRAHHAWKEIPISLPIARDE
jgi:hypothetical protein